MSKTHSIAVFLLLCVIGNAICSTHIQDIYVSGEFVLAVVDDDELTHISSLGSFDPDTGVWEDKFGGVYQTLHTHPFNQIEYTNSGLYVTGDFTFIGPKNIYSPSVALYTEVLTTTGELQRLGNGIWLEGATGAPETINWIVGVGNNTLFAGTFSSIEDISLAADEPVVVPHIAQWTSDLKWELLPNEDNVFPEGDYILGVATSPDGLSDIAFIYTESPSDESSAVFSWSSEIGFNHVSPTGFGGFNGGNFVVDSLGNPAGISVTALGDEYFLVFLDASSSFANSSYSIAQYPDGTAYPPVLLPYLDGILIAVSAGETKTTFHFWNSTSKEYFTAWAAVPGFEYSVRDIHHLVTGLNGELWFAPIASTPYIYQYTPGTPIWTQISLYELKTVALDVVSLTYDWHKKALYGYGTDQAGYHGVWFAIPSEHPLGQEKNPGPASFKGRIASAVVVESTEDDSFALWIGGAFSNVGAEGVAALNLAVWKDGVWTGHDAPLIAAMALYQNHTMFFGQSNCVENGEALPVSWFPVDMDNALPDPFGGVFPLVTGGDGCISTIATYKDEIFFGGNFSVQLPGTTASAHGVVHYNVTSKEWKGIDIPPTIQSTGEVYTILSMVVVPGIGATGADVLFIGGHFEFNSTNQNNYAGFAAYSLVEGEGWLSVKTFTPDTVVHEIIPGTGTKLFIGGSLKLSENALSEGVIEYDFSNNTFTEVGMLSDIANSILLTTLNADDDDESNDEVTVYAGGNLQNLPKTEEYPVASFDFTAQLEGGTDGNWTKTGSNIFQNYFLGEVTYLLYETGGSGEGGENGNASDPDSGISGWWITVIVLVCLGAVVLLVAAAVAGAWYYKKKNSYQQID